MDGKGGFRTWGHLGLGPKGRTGPWGQYKTPDVGGSIRAQRGFLAKRAFLASSYSFIIHSELHFSMVFYHKLKKLACLRSQDPAFKAPGSALKKLELFVS